MGGGGRRTNLRGAHLAYLAASQALAVRHSQEEFNKEDKEFDALEWLAAMCFHVPNKGEQMVRYGACPPLAMWNLARDYALYADLFKRKGDLSKAQENVTKAIEIFKECGADGWVEK